MLRMNAARVMTLHQIDEPPSLVPPLWADVIDLADSLRIALRATDLGLANNPPRSAEAAIAMAQILAGDLRRAQQAITSSSVFVLDV